MLVDMLGLPESILGSLDLLRLKWCSEPSVHGGKKTAPDVIPAQPPTSLTPHSRLNTIAVTVFCYWTHPHV